MQTEKQLQAWAMKQFKKAGILAYKFASPSVRGVPDLLLVFPDGVTEYVELKSPTGAGRLSTLQKVTINKLLRQGATVHVCHTTDQITRVINRTAAGCDQFPV